MMHWVYKAEVHNNLGGELKRRGWEVYDYSPAEIDLNTDYFRECLWSGLATHPKVPGVVLTILPNKFNTLDGQTPGLIVYGGATLSTDTQDKPLPAYSMPKKGMSWHLEREGGIIKQGRIPKALWADRRNEKTASEQFVNKVEQALGIG